MWSGINFEDDNLVQLDDLDTDLDLEFVQGLDFFTDPRLRQEPSQLIAPSENSVTLPIVTEQNVGGGTHCQDFLEQIAGDEPLNSIIHSSNDVAQECGGDSISYMPQEIGDISLNNEQCNDGEEENESLCEAFGNAGGAANLRAKPGFNNDYQHSVYPVFVLNSPQQLPVSSSSTNEAKRKFEDKKRRNNISQKKSRLKKKENDIQLKRVVQELEEENESLNFSTSQLEQKLKILMDYCNEIKIGGCKPTIDSTSYSEGTNMEQWLDIGEFLNDNGFTGDIMKDGPDSIVAMNNEITTNDTATAGNSTTSVFLRNTVSPWSVDNTKTKKDEDDDDLVNFFS